jgi:ElaB/YqjD/DUF883 family membrane-anchored ribosome-binding protein
LEKFELSHAQQVPKPPAPGPGNIPPLQPDIPVPDPTPAPIENPGDQPFPPITDPDVIEPGEPNPAHTPMRMRGLKRKTQRSSAPKGNANSRNERSNLFPSSELELGIMEATLADPSNADGVIASASVNDLTPRNWRIDMSSMKPVQEASQEFAADFAALRHDVTKELGADLAALRDDVTKLTSSMSEFIRTQTAETTNTVFDAVDNARKKISDTASKAQDRVAGASTDLETTIERNPLVAVLIAMVAGILVGLLSRGRK